MKAGGKSVESEIPGLHAESFVLDFYGTMFDRGWVFLRVTLKLLVSLRCPQIDATLPDKLITENVVGQDFSGLAQYFKLSREFSRSGHVGRQLLQWT